MTDEVENGEVEKIETTPNSEAETSKEVEPETTNQEDGKPKKSRFQKRINQITKEKGELARELDKERQEKEELKRQLQDMSVKANPKPSRDNYEDFNEYEADLIKWSQSQTAEASKSDDTPATADEIEYADRLQNTFDAAEDKYEDFGDKINSIPVLSKELAREALDSDISEDILYYLGSNHDVAEKLSKLSGGALTKEVAKLEAKIEAGVINPQSVSSQKQTSKAPDPIETVKESGGSTTDLSNVSMDEYMKRETKRIYGKYEHSL